jgi:hypothetical protein
MRGKGAFAVIVSLGTGVIIGGDWIFFILYTHLSLATATEKATTGAILTDTTLLESALSVVGVGILAAFQARRFTTGLAAGAGVGLLAGLLAMLITLVMLDASMSVLVTRMTASEAQAFTQSGWVNRAAWYFWNEEAFGAFGYFATLFVGALPLAVIGAALGNLLAVAARRQTRRAEAPETEKV